MFFFDTKQKIMLKTIWITLWAAPLNDSCKFGSHNDCATTSEDVVSFAATAS